MEKEKRKVQRREGVPSIFGEGDQHLLLCMLLTLSVCHFDTSPLNAEAPLNTVTSNKREEKTKESQKHVVGR